MARRTPEGELEVIEAAVRRHPDGATTRQIASALEADLPLRTLQYRLKLLVGRGRLVMEGERRSARYLVPAAADEPQVAGADTRTDTERGAAVPLSKRGTDIRAYLRQPPAARTPAGYRRGFLEAYRPNVSFHLSVTQRSHLGRVGQSTVTAEPAGTYARRILDRLLIDLSWNSSRLEGNTYSLLDTRRLIEFGQEADGRARLEAQMILNHKEAIEFLVDAADDIGFNRHTLLNLHAILASNLLPDEAASGRLRRIPVGIEQSVFHPLEVPQLIEECFDQILTTTAAIGDPFEQAFFIMVHLPYLQPFDDVNKRVSRLAANIPFIRHNLCPLSFTDVPRSTYTEAVLGVYELNRVDLLRDVFIWAYERSAARYAAVRQSLGEPDPFRLRHRAALGTIVGEVVRRLMDRRTAVDHIAGWAQANVEPASRDRFRELAESELLGLHEGNFARYRIRPTEYRAWRVVWSGAAS